MTAIHPTGPRHEGALTDSHGRSKQKLRVSLTDRCNFRCSYCMPEDPAWLPKTEILRYEELQRLIRLFVTELGITHLRLTGGEPLLRKGVEGFVESLQALRPLGLRRISMTSNGTLLGRLAEPLKRAGLDDLNVSIDSIDPARFAELTRGELEPVLEGILAARDVGLPIKLNAVIIRDRNVQDVLPLAEWAYAQRISLRYIEFMPLDAQGGWSPQRVVPEAEIIELLAQRFSVQALPRTRDPATYYRLQDDFQVGVISTVSNPFCASCDRVRVAATGEIYPCLFSPLGIDLKQPMREGVDDQALTALIRQAVWRKGKGFIESAGYVKRAVGMHAMGG